MRLRLLVPALLLASLLLLASAPAQAACAVTPSRTFPVPSVYCYEAVATRLTNVGCEVYLNPQPEPPRLPFATACASAAFVAGQAAFCNVRVGPSVFLPPNPCVLRPTET